LFSKIKGIEFKESFPVMSYDQAMHSYGTDKPDLRFSMTFNDLTDRLKGNGFVVFDDAHYIAGINAVGCGHYTRKQLDSLTDWVKRPQIGAKGLVYLKYNEDGSLKSSVDKFYSSEELKAVALACSMNPGDLLLILSGEKDRTLKQLGELRLHMGDELNLRDAEVFKPLWVVDFPLLEWDEDQQRFHAKHHPFTSPKTEDIHLLNSDPGKVRANAYDLAMNGVELGGGSIRIHDRALQERMFDLLGFTPDEAKAQFGFLMNAFEFGAPPHGGLAFGLDRLVATMGGSESIRDFIAFPKNNSGRDTMIDAPSPIHLDQLKELGLSIEEKN